MNNKPIISFQLTQNNIDEFLSPNTFRASDKYFLGYGDITNQDKAYQYIMNLLEPLRLNKVEGNHIPRKIWYCNYCKQLINHLNCNLNKQSLQINFLEGDDYTEEEDDDDEIILENKVESGNDYTEEEEEEDKEFRNDNHGEYLIYQCGHIYCSQCLNIFIIEKYIGANGWTIIDNIKVHYFELDLDKLKDNYPSYQDICPICLNETNSKNFTNKNDRINMYYDRHLTLPKKYLRYFLDEFEEGDTIDCHGYRGTGLYYYDGVSLIKSEGEYGYFLPTEAFKMVKKKGLKTFELTGAEFVRIPENLSILQILNDTPNSINNDGNYALSIYCYDDSDKEIVIVDGIEYISNLIEYY